MKLKVVTFVFICVGIFIACLEFRRLPKSSNSWPISTVYPPDNWKRKTFSPSHNFPKRLPHSSKPWSNISFKDYPQEYMQKVLQYCLEGNIEVEWDVLKNQKRKWFHVPWMTVGTYGREPLKGLTRERTSQPFELASTQSTPAQNWAIGYFNEEGGYAIGQIWESPSSPNVKPLNFPDGTISFKLLFTNAKVEEVPYLKNSLTWDIYLHDSIDCTPDSDPNSVDCARKIDKVRLLQVDIAVKDNRSESTGWVFGTYVYNGNKDKINFWDRLELVGVMWGNDPNKLEGQLVETKLFDTEISTHVGCNGRLNGPVDNPNSSCLSCHAKAGYPYFFDFGPEESCNSISSDEFDLHFQNVLFPDVYINKQKFSFDYSLQLAMSVANFEISQK